MPANQRSTKKKIQGNQLNEKNNVVLLVKK